MASSPSEEPPAIPRQLGSALVEEFEKLSGRKVPDVIVEQTPSLPKNVSQEILEALQLREKEKERLLFSYIHSLRQRHRPTALCLSGGGIRSATFCLGVLQGLAATGRLSKFRYLSTVSGGGYVGSWLSNWLRNSAWDFESVEKSLAGGPQSTPILPAKDPVSRLRAYSNFLSPVGGLSGDTLSLSATFIRNLVLNLCVWLPLIAAAVLLPRLFFSALLNYQLQPGPPAIALAVLSLVLIVVGVAYLASDLPGDSPPRTPPANRFGSLCFLPIFLATVLLSALGACVKDAPIAVWHFALAGAGVHLVGIASSRPMKAIREIRVLRRPWNWRGFWMACGSGAAGGALLGLVWEYGGLQDRHTPDSLVAYATLSVPMLLGSFWLAMTLYAGFARNWTSEDDREWWSRAGAWWLITAAVWIACFAFVGYLAPLLLATIGVAFPAVGQLSLGSAVLGILTSAIGYWSKNGSELKQKADSALTVLGNRVLSLAAGLVLLLAFLAMNLAMTQFIPFCPQFLQKLTICSNGFQSQVAFVRSEAAIAASGANDVGLVGEAAPVNSGEAAAYAFVLLNAPPLRLLGWILCLSVFAFLVSKAIGANTFSLHGMYGNRLVRAYLGTSRDTRKPHWLTGFDPDDNVPLASFTQSELRPKRRRLFHVINMAMNLVLPSERRLAWQQRKAASFVATPLHCGSEGTGFANTDAYASTRGGMTLGRALTISGAAASPNMGYHSSALVTLVMTLFNVRLGWWLSNPSPSWKAGWQRSEPRVGISALFAEAFGRTTDDAASVYLSDGGHFENLGIYEMVRRRCFRILVIDATCDPKFDYADLHNAVRKIRVDFGIQIDVPTVLPGHEKAPPTQRLAVCRIRYAERDGGDPKKVDGYLYVLKPLLAGTEPPDVADYAASVRSPSSPFPHQSTADQFFDETQFESYRLLGLVSLKASLPSRSRWPKLNPRAAVPPTAKPPLPVPTPQKPVAGKPAPGLLGALAEAAQGLSTGAALATAVTVGGTLGVAGTVGLTNSEVTLSREDRALLQQNISTRAKPDDLSSNLSAAEKATIASLSAQLDAVIQDMGSVQAALDPRISGQLVAIAFGVDKLIAAIPPPPGVRPGPPPATPPGASPGTTPATPPGAQAAAPPAATSPLPATTISQIEQIHAATRSIEERLGAIKQVVDTSAELLNTMRQGSAKADPPADANLTAIADQLRAANKLLISLGATMREASPRRNIRGLEGTSR